MNFSLVPDWGLVAALAGAEALAMITLALLFWRHNARASGRVVNYLVGCLGLLAGLVVWAASTPGPVAPAAVPLVFAALLIGAGAGTVLPRAILYWQARAAVREAAAAEASHG